MTNDFPLQYSHEDSECEAYNAAFHELGFDWHWDRATYATLLQHSAQPEARLRHYVETTHPHLLKAYDADFLVAAIHDRKKLYQPGAHRRDDWALATLW
jgi:hypothetical protein